MLERDLKSARQSLSAKADELNNSESSRTALEDKMKKVRADVSAQHAELETWKQDNERLKGLVLNF